MHAITDLISELSLFEERFKVITDCSVLMIVMKLFQEAIKEKKEGLD